MTTIKRKALNLALNMGMEMLGESMTSPKTPAYPEILDCPPVTEFMRLVRKTGGGVCFIIGERYTGKTVLCERIAEGIRRPTYAICPEDSPAPWIKEIEAKDLTAKPRKVPPFSTLVFNDAQAIMDTRSYSDATVHKIEQMIPVVRKRPKLALLVNTQVSAMVDKYIMMADLVIFKPLTFFWEDLERGAVVKLGRWSEPLFGHMTRAQQQRHCYVFGKYPRWRGLCRIDKPFGGQYELEEKEEDEEDADMYSGAMIESWGQKEEKEKEEDGLDFGGFDNYSVEDLRGEMTIDSNNLEGDIVDG